MAQFRKHGLPPYGVVMLHGGPGAPGGMYEVAHTLSQYIGIIEPLQTGLSVSDQLSDLHHIIMDNCPAPVKLVGHSWGAWLACLFAAYYPALTEKIILIGAGSFKKDYSNDIMKIRLDRLHEKKKSEAMILSALVKEGKASNANFRRFGELMSEADSYDPLPEKQEVQAFYPEVFNAVWPEAEKLRKSGELTTLGHNIMCPVMAIHGGFDPHPASGVKEPLQKTVRNFRFVLLKKCGHYPWRERYAREEFYRILTEELGSNG